MSWTIVNACMFCKRENVELVRVGPNIICVKCLEKLRESEKE